MNDTDNINIHEVFDDTAKVQENLITKIKELETKLSMLKQHEDILTSFISRAQDQLDNLDSKQFKLRGQLQNTIMRQVSLLNEIYDAEVKLEKLIQDYHKMMLDIQTSKVNMYAKIKSITQENADEQRLLDVINGFETTIKHLSSNSSDTFSNTPAINLEEEITTQLEKEGYKL